MHEVLKFARQARLPNVPELALESDDPRVVGYLDHGLVASVEIPDTTLEAVRLACSVLGDVQKIVLTPEVLAGVLGGVSDEIDGVPVVRYPGGDDRAEYVGRMGPTVESGSVAVSEVASVAHRFQSVLVFVGEGGDPTPDD